MKWTSCSDFLSGRSGKQCRERWFNTLNPNVKKGGWTPEEDFLIFKFFSEFGSKWSLIASKFPGRTENSVKNRFYSTLRRISLDKKKNLFGEKKNVNNVSNGNNGNVVNNINNNAINNFGNFSNFNYGNAEINSESNYGANFNSSNNNNNNNSNNCLNNSFAIENFNNNNLTANDHLNAAFPSSNLEELMKYLPQAFAEKTRIYLEFKKNEGQLAENLNINIESFQDLQKINLSALTENSNLQDNKIIKAKKAFSSKKDLSTISNNNNKNNINDNYFKNLSSTFETNKNASGIINYPSLTNFMQCGVLNEIGNKIALSEHNNKKNFDGNSEVGLAVEEDKKTAERLLNKKRIRENEKKESVSVLNQINNTFNFDFNINNNVNNIEKSSSALQDKSIIKGKKNSASSETSISKTNNINNNNTKKKKFVTKKFPKIEELEKLIENFTETTSKANSCASSLKSKTDIKNNTNQKTKSKGKTIKKSEAEIKSKASDAFSIKSNKPDSSIGKPEKENSAADVKEFLFKVPEICSNEEVTKLSLNLMQRRNNSNDNNNSNSNIRSRNNNNNSKIKENNNDNCENYLYLENQISVKAGKSKKSEKEEIFKFDALNNLYDQLNNLENILLNTRKQLFNLDNFYYKENNIDSNINSKSSPEINNNFSSNGSNQASKITEHISTNIDKLNQGINLMKNLSRTEITQQANLNNYANNINEILLQNKNFELKNLESMRFNNENNEFKKVENFINENLIKQEAMNTLPNIFKSALFMQDDLHYLNINEAANIKIGNFKQSQNINANININNLFNSNLMFNNCEGQIQEEFHFMDNMFQI